MRIAIVTEGWLPTVNGMVTRISATVRELRRRGHEVLVVSVTSDGPDHHGARVETVPSFRIRGVYGGAPWGLPAPGLVRRLRAFRPDVVHVVAPAFLGMSGVFAARLLRCPLVCSYHTDLLAYADYYGLGRMKWLIRRLMRLSHNRADLNLVTSEHARRQLADLGIGPVRLWPRGIDDTFRQVGSGSPESAAPAGGVEALYVGRLAQEKNLDSLRPLADTPGVTLTLAGDGPHRAALQARLGSARFTGEVHGADLRRLYARADVFVFPSMTDTLGLVLLEALASGLPVVAAASPAAVEVLRGCSAARLYTDPADAPAAVADLLASAPREELRRIARAQVAGISWSSATESLLEIYREARSARSRHHIRLVPAGAEGI